MKKLSVRISAAAAAVTVCLCGNVFAAGSSDSSETAEETDAEETAEEETLAENEVLDPAGNIIELPDNDGPIISMAPSNTRILIDLGLSDRIGACDTYSEMYYGDQLPEDIQTFDMMQPDQEQIVAMDPYIVFTTGMSYAGGEDVYASVREAGVCVADIPTASSIAEIQEDIVFIGACTGTEDEAEAIVSDMQDTVDEIISLSENIDEDGRKTVLLVTSTPTADYPTIYAAGSGTYIDEILTDVGLVNAAADAGDAWPALTEEAAAALNPDIIISIDTYTEDVVDTWLSMDGWENVTAVQNGDVYLLDYSNELNQPNQHVVSAMVEIAKDIYPDVYEDLEDPFAEEDSE